MLTRKIGTKKDAVWSDKFIHSGEGSFMGTQRCLVIKTLEVLQEFIMRQQTSHVPGKNCDSSGEEWRSPAHVRQNNLDIWVLAFLACDCQVGSGFKSFVRNLRYSATINLETYAGV